ncbi:NirA family protein [Marinomonas sp. C2222]|uniref:NirA family protein n=1 Tax=Marinomonas sargassi TaxID=2984494 RepID=A0ABT2YU57_9GAMM|nr:NirA family protein [Marinomonas sargassi]MCV2403412.1 NirA family protein [Marinomonas sargassi]
MSIDTNNAVSIAENSNLDTSSIIASSNAAPAPQGFTAEQKRYMASLLVDLNLHVALGAGQNAAEEIGPETFWGTPVEDLCKQETAKYERHVLDIWDDIVAHNNNNQIAEGIKDFMFRHHGLFNVMPAMEGFMTRLRIPGCKLRGDQMIGLGDIAEDIAGGYAHITTRGSFQMREIPPNKILALNSALYDIGLSSKGSGADSARNITATPTAGFDPEELINLHKYAVEVSHRILNTRDLHGIPRKFNISFDNAGTISVVSDTNDVGYLAVKVKENSQGVDAGIYCRILFGGITGHEDFARDTGLICRPEDTPEISEAILRVFLEHGDRTNRKKARFKYVLDQHGFDWVCEKVQEKLDGFGNGVKMISLSRDADEPRPVIKRQAHIGVHPQAQKGLNYIGVALRLGRMSPEQMRGAGRIAQKYGSNDIRLTVWQNFLIADVADADVAAAVSELEALGMSVDANSFAAGAVSCTGRWACKLANAYTKEDASNIVDHLQARFELDSPINIHLTGCPNSCAQHYIGDIGLVGTAAEDGSEGYNVLVGGGCDDDQGLARMLCGPVASRDICQVLEKVVGNYMNGRKQGESFLAFTRGLEDSQLTEQLLA